MNGYVQHRGLPPPPHGDFISDGNNPPPCPREMYSPPGGIYDVIPANQNEYGMQKRAPPPPKRSSNTRLSTSSRNSSSSSGIYEDTANIQDIRHSPVPQVQPQQYGQPSSPISHPMSPQLQKKVMGSPLSPSHQNPNKPFSYITNLPGSPNQKRKSGGQHHDPSEVSPVDPTYEPIGHGLRNVNQGQGQQPNHSAGQYGVILVQNQVHPDMNLAYHQQLQLQQQQQQQQQYSANQHYVQGQGQQYVQGQGQQYVQGQGQQYAQGYQYPQSQGQPYHQGQQYSQPVQSPQHMSHNQYTAPPMQQQQLYSPSHRTASPPPLPNVGNVAPHSPKLQRQSSLTRKDNRVPSPVQGRVASPVLGRKSQDIGATKDNVIRPEHSRSGHGPPSFPAPPPPLPVAARFVAAALENNRPPSPPLPPPPPEIGDTKSGVANNRQSSALPVQSQSPKPVAPPPPPPIANIPGKAAVSSFQIGKKSPQKQDNHVDKNANRKQMDLNQQNLIKQQQLQSKNLAEELSKIALRKPANESAPVQPPPPSQQNSKAPEPPVTKSKQIATKDKPKSSTERELETGPLLLPKLKTTGVKPWEKDVSPGAVSSNVLPQGGDDLPPPPPPPESPDNYPPPPPPPTQEQAVYTADMYQAGGQQRMKKDASPDAERRQDSGIGSNSSLSSMEIDLDDIDLSQIPGYTPMSSAIPNWKRDMIEKKNREKIEEYVQEIRRKKAEEEKWKNVPEWKRKLLIEKDKLQKEKETEAERAALERQKQKQREAEEQRREDRRRQIEEQAEEEDDAEMPAWKKEIMKKRGGAPRNWGDEREEANEENGSS